MSFFEGLFESAVSAFVGSAASAGGQQLVKSFTEGDKKTTKAYADPTVAPGTPYSQVDPLKGLEEPKPPQGVSGFMGNVMVKPSRSREQYNPILTDGLNGLIQSVMRDPPATPKMVQEIQNATSANKITSSKRSTKALKNLFTT
jgi:hypothetical protein